jgi:hypothetical protein
LSPQKDLPSSKLQVVDHTSAKPVLTSRSLQIGEIIGPLPLDYHGARIMGSLGEDGGGEFLDPAVLAGNHLRLIFSRFRLDRAVHTSSDIRWARRIRMDEPLKVQGCLADVVHRKERIFLVFTTETLDGDDKVVSQERTELLVLS